MHWGDSSAEQVGDWVLAVGNPFGLGGTVSSGIISARGRDIHAGPYDDFLQIDASINRGNSGGPTFNLDGQVIGINTAIYSPNGGSVGIGFAIPSSLAKPVIEQLQAHGKVERGWLGVQIQDVTPEIAKSLGLPKAEGALVADVTSGGPAANAGLKQGDVILSYEGHDIAKLRDLPLAVAETPVGEKAPVKLWRDGHEQTVDTTIAAMPAHPEQVARDWRRPRRRNRAMGLRLAPLDTAWRERLHLNKEVKGVVVTAVSQSSPLAEPRPLARRRDRGDQPRARHDARGGGPKARRRRQAAERERAAAHQPPRHQPVRSDVNPAQRRQRVTSKRGWPDGQPRRSPR